MNATLSRKLNKILETPIDDADLLQSLLYLSNFYSVNDINGRRNLRGEIEKRNFEINQKFLQNFELVQQELQKIENSVNLMKSSYQNMEEIFYKTQKTAGAIIEDTHSLQTANLKIDGKYKFISKFIETFQLSEEEKSNLINFSKEEDNKPSEQFFHSLKRVQDINANCKLLLRTGHQKAGLEIMDVMSILQQTAYDQLYRWILSEFQHMNDQISPEFPIELNWALKALMHERPVLLQYCLDTIIDSRSKTIFQAFIRALQHGGPNGIPKPIEIHSHDPFRYVGDMLGCLHQLLASEYELHYSLFYQKKNSPSGPSVSSPSRPSISNLGRSKEKEEIDPDTKTQIMRILSKSFESVCRPFQVRVEQVINSQSEIVTLFRLVNLFDFYMRTILKIVAEDCLLIATIQNSKKQTMQLLFDLIQKQSDFLQVNPPLPPLDLSPPQLVHQTVNQLMEIMSYFDSSLVPVEEREEDFKPILNSIVDPLIRMCNLSATILENPGDMAVYLINNFSLIQSSLISYSFALFKAELINGQIDAHMGTLVQEESIATLRKCKLASKLEIFQDWKSKSPREPLSRILDMDARQLSDSMRSFEQSLFDIGAMVLPQCEKLYSSRLKAKARGQVSEMIVNSFTSLYQEIVDPTNLYENPALIVPYKPEQVRMMLCHE